MNVSTRTNMQHKIQTSTELSREEVAQRAYHLWEAAGRPVGQDLEHWLQAEEELLKANGLHQADRTKQPSDRHLSRRTDEKQIGKRNRKDYTRAGEVRDRLAEVLP